MTFVSPIIAENDLLFDTMGKIRDIVGLQLFSCLICTIFPDALSDPIYFFENI